ncbi:MAG: Fic family protein [Actinomycetota bacterium]
MQGQSLTWTDQLGRTYEYTPYEAELIGDLLVDFSPGATLAIAEASSSLGSVPALPAAGIASVLYRSESSASSLIEGLGPGPRRILEAEVAVETEIEDEAARRVVSNLDALRDATESALPIRLADILRWHRKLMEAHPHLSPESSGSFRSQQNWIGGDAFGPRNARFVPPRPVTVPALIDDLVTFCARTDLAPVAHAAIAHARFEVIHPFIDGNGRVGRLLIQPLLRRRFALPSLVPISVIWSQDTNRYVEGLRTYQEGDVNGWIEFFSVSVIQAVEWMVDMMKRIVALLADFHSRVETRGESVTARIIDDLPEHPIADSPTVARRYGVTPQSAHAALLRLEEAGILRERTFARRRRGRPTRAFAATELIDLLL